MSAYLQALLMEVAEAEGAEGQKRGCYRALARPYPAAAPRCDTTMPLRTCKHDILVLRHWSLPIVYLSGHGHPQLTLDEAKAPFIDVTLPACLLYWLARQGKGGVQEPEKGNTVPTRHITARAAQF